MLPRVTEPPRQQRGGGTLRAADFGRAPTTKPAAPAIKAEGQRGAPLRVSLRRVRFMQVRACVAACVASPRARYAGVRACVAACVPSPRARYAGVRACVAVRARASLRVLHCRVGVLLVRACVAACVAQSFCREQVRACVAACVAPSRGRAVGARVCQQRCAPTPLRPPGPTAGSAARFGAQPGSFATFERRGSARVAIRSGRRGPTGQRRGERQAAPGPNQAARLTRESKWSALRATSLADRPRWRPEAPTGSDLGVSCGRASCLLFALLAPASQVKMCIPPGYIEQCAEWPPCRVGAGWAASASPLT